MNLIGAPEQTTTAISLRWITSVFLALQAILWLMYLYVKRTGGTKPEAVAALRWLIGSNALGFWLGCCSAHIAALCSSCLFLA